MKTIFVRSPYNYDMNEAGDAGGIECKDKSLAQQHMADECDINKLVDRFAVTGEMPQLTMPPLQGDFTHVPTYQEALNLMIEANQSFLQLPAKVRNRFENDPGKFIDFVSDSNNRDEMRQMGLWSPEAIANFEAKAQAQAAAKTAQEAREARLNEILDTQPPTPKGSKGDRKPVT